MTEHFPFINPTTREAHCVYCGKKIEKDSDEICEVRVRESEL